MTEETFLEQFSSQYRWQAAPAKRRFRFRKEVNKSMRESHRLALTMRGVIDRSLDDLEGLQASDYSTYQIFGADDLVFKLIDLENIKTSRVGLVPRRGIMSPAYIRLVPNHSEADSRFYAWFFFAAYLNNIFNGMGGGVRQNLTPTDLLEFPIPLLELATQRQTADFLDRETARISLLIEKKQRLVALLEDRYERHRDQVLSVNDEDLPQQSMRWLIRVGSGDFISNEEMSSEQSPDRPIPVIGGNGVMAYTDRSNTPTNTLVIGRVGALCGNVHFFEHRSWVTDNALIVRLTSKEIVPKYAFEVLKSAKLNEKANKSAQPLITGETVKKVMVRLPPKHEQERRVRRLAELSTKLSRTTTTVLSSIDRLKEYRSALITAAVTGQIDVSTYATSGNPDRRLDAIQEEMSA